MARLACIIPVMGTTDGLETTLVSVLERRPDDCEVAVVLNVPYDDPYQLSGEVQFLRAPSRAGLVQCLNLGIGATRSPIVHTLASGFEVADGWAERARTHFCDPRIAAVTLAIHHAADRERLIAAGVGYHRGGSKVISRQPQVESQLQSVGPLLQAAFIRREALTAFGGVLPTTVGDSLADIDLALTLRRAGWQLQFDPKCQVFAPGIDELQTAGFKAGIHAERLFWRHWNELGRVAGLAAHPLSVASNVLGARPAWKIPLSALGRLIGFCQFGQYRGYRQTLAAATFAAEQAHAEWQTLVAESSRRDAGSRDGQSRRIDRPHPSGRPVEAEPTRSTRRKTVRD